MEVLLGFSIALAISLTGVGAGSMTTPLLILLLRVPPSVAVGTALTFGAIVKVVSIPVYLWRGQVHLKTLFWMLAGGVPGVIGGSMLLTSLKNSTNESFLYASLGGLISLTAAFHLYRTLRPQHNVSHRDRTRLLPWLTLPIGAEVGFSSAGAGALGSLLLFGLTGLSTSAVVGTDLCFGLVLSTLGSAVYLSTGSYDGALLLQLAMGGVAGAIAGSLLSGRIAQVPLRRVVLALLIVLGFQLATHGRSSPQPVQVARRQ